MMFRSVTTLLLPLLFSFTVANSDITFDVDAAGRSYCKSMLAKDDGDEFEFDRWCVREDGFEKCAMTCTGILSKPPSMGTCKSGANNFYSAGLVFEEVRMTGPTTTATQKVPYHWSKSAKGRSTIFAMIPLWPTQSTYFYNMLEKISLQFADDVVVVIQPLVIPEAVRLVVDEATDTRKPVVPEIIPLETTKIHFLPYTHSSLIERTPFGKFMDSQQLDNPGFPSMELLGNSPVFFIVDKDGMTVERVVCPTFKGLEAVVQKKIVTES